MAGANAVTVVTPEQVNVLRSMAAQTAQYALPLVEALAAGRITLALPQRHHRAPLDVLRRSSRPVIMALSDDDYRSTGPDGWRCAHQAARWARAVMVHASGGEREHYAAAVEAATTKGRLLLVETAARFAPAWTQLMAGKPTLVIVPRDGVHPVPLRAEEVH